ncbi:MAG: Hsp20/alpha crystallin family protein [Oscillospiraceae bacterium]|nr:Hsp20/alpha crystallin family protein [Oscillospiraceae bacterium]
MFELIPFERTMRNLNSFSPFRQMEEMQRSFFNANSASSLFRTDVSDLGDAYKLEAELPGFSKDDININIEDERMTISVERKMDNSEDKPNYLRRERFYGSYSRSFDLSGIDSDNISASYADGVLSLNLPKQAAAVPASRRLEIN